MQFDTVERGLVKFVPATGCGDDTGFFDGAGQAIRVRAVYRAAHDGMWHAQSLPRQSVTLQIHNIGAPAYYSAQERGSWSRFGARHREDGPAAQVACVLQATIDSWWLHGLIHRIDGPASCWNERWHVEGKVIGPRGWQRRARRLRWLLCVA